MSRVVLCLSTLLPALLLPASLRAADTEQRSFAVILDGSQAGEFTMTAQPAEEGGTLFTAQAVIQAKPPHVLYRANYRSSETWKDGKLQHLDAQSEVDGKKRQVVATPNKTRMRVTVNGQRSDVSADVWTTTFLRLPEEAKRNGAVPLLLFDSGKELAGKLEYLAVERLTIFGQPVECAHYRLVAEGLQADLWYDGSDRLVRKESVENGHKFRLELTRVQR